MSAAAGSKQWDYLEQIDNSFISQNYSLFKARGMENCHILQQLFSNLPICTISFRKVDE